MSKKHHYRTVWLSDIHLGSDNCKVDMIQSFISEVKADTIILVGDIIDGWAIKRRWNSVPQSHLNVIRTLMTKAKKDTQIYYVVGNHDEFIRKFHDFFPFQFGNIHIDNEFVYDTLTNGQIWNVHGDLYDCITRMHKWISVLGDIGYTLLVTINKWFNNIRQRIGYPYWSVSNYAKQKVKRAVEFITNFEDIVSLECSHRGYSGVVCGHIHTPIIKELNGIIYYNTGDWVENCTALVEHLDGTMEIIYYDK